jgi:pyroglutamyl-peptidase
MQYQLRCISFVVVVLFFSLSISSTGVSTLHQNAADSQRSQPVVLLTGFEPFDVYTVNPSQLVVEALDNQTINGALIIGLVLPVNFTESDVLLSQAIEQYQPVFILSLGLAPKATTLEVEKCAMNIKRYPLDNGRLSFPRRINSDGPFVRLSPLSTHEIVQELNKNNIPVKQSFFAGTYLCNYVFYQSLGYVQNHSLSTKVGFIHLPLLDSQSPDGMKLETMVDAVRLTISYSLR